MLFGRQNVKQELVSSEAFATIVVTASKLSTIPGTTITGGPSEVTAVASTSSSNTAAPKTIPTSAATDCQKCIILGEQVGKAGKSCSDPKFLSVAEGCYACNSKDATLGKVASACGWKDMDTVFTVEVAQHPTPTSSPSPSPSLPHISPPEVAPSPPTSTASPATTSESPLFTDPAQASSDNTKWIAGILVAIVPLLAIVGAVWWLRRRRKTRATAATAFVDEENQGPPEYESSYEKKPRPEGEEEEGNNYNYPTYPPPAVVAELSANPTPPLGSRRYQQRFSVDNSTIDSSVSSDTDSSSGSDTVYVVQMYVEDEHGRGRSVMSCEVSPSRSRNSPGSRPSSATWRWSWRQSLRASLNNFSTSSAETPRGHQRTSSSSAGSRPNLW